MGPEVSLSVGRKRHVGPIVARDRWVKTRTGLHAHGLTFGNFGLNASAGYEWRLRQRPASYAEITALYSY